MKKKILFINNHFQRSDGTVRALIGLVNNLDLEKFDITILALYRCDKSLAKELKPGIKLISAFGFYFRGFSKIANLIPVKHLYNRWIKSQYDIEVAFQCDLPTLLICNSQNPLAVHVAWMHGYECYEAYNRLDKVCCVSKYCADKAKEEMNDRINVTYRYNLVDEKPILDKAKESIELQGHTGLTFVSVGRHSPEKGYPRLVKILSELKDEGFEFHLILIGDGPQHEEIKNEINKCNMKDYITLTGAQNNPHKFTVRSDVFICSSYSEGYSTACTEAAILGIPIITTCVPGGEEIIGECECGLVTDIDNDSLKNGIRKVLENPILVNKWKKTMKETSSKFEMKARKRAVVELFDEFYELSERKKKHE